MVIFLLVLLFFQRQMANFPDTAKPNEQLLPLKGQTAFHPFPSPLISFPALTLSHIFLFLFPLISIIPFLFKLTPSAAGTTHPTTQLFLFHWILVFSVVPPCYRTNSTAGRSSATHLGVQTWRGRAGFLFSCSQTVVGLVLLNKAITWKLHPSNIFPVTFFPSAKPV